MKRYVVGFILVLILAASAGIVLERTRLLAWYYAQRLARADAADRTPWVDRLISLDEAALPGLIRWLSKDDPTACANCRVALLTLAERWTPDAQRTSDLFDQLSKAYAGFSVVGQQSALDLAREFLKSKSAGQSSKTGTGASPAWLESCQDLARKALKDSGPENRIKAIQLAQLPGINSLEEVVPLLSDPAPEVRQAAMLALGPASDAIADDDLLVYLHDPDIKVRQLCETALRGRGLRDDHLKLGKMMTDHRPEVRLQILEYLRRTNELDPGAWLRRLSHDPSSAVRAAAIRAAAEQPLVDLRDRLEQMVQNDPSPTVQQLARYYLSSQKKRISHAGERE